MDRDVHLERLGLRVPYDQRVIASVTVVWSDPLMWGDRTDPAGYIHMLMVPRDLAGHGIGRALLAWAEDFVVDTGRRLARLDCVRNNRSCALLRTRRVRAGWPQGSPGGRVGARRRPLREASRPLAIQVN